MPKKIVILGTEQAHAQLTTLRQEIARLTGVVTATEKSLVAIEDTVLTGEHTGAMPAAICTKVQAALQEALSPLYAASGRAHVTEEAMQRLRGSLEACLQSSVYISQLAPQKDYILRCQR